MFENINMILQHFNVFLIMPLSISNMNNKITFPNL